MTDRAGILPKSPLVYALASTRFAAWPLMLKKIEEIHDELRDILPIIHRIQMQAVGPSGETQVDNRSWMLLSSDRSIGIQLAPDQMLVFTNKYRRYSDFEEVLRRGFNVLVSHMRFLDVTSMGARYIDHVHVREGETFESYIAASLLPPTFGGFERTGGVTFGSYRISDAELRVRCMSLPDTPAIPEDLFGLLAMVQAATGEIKIPSLGKNDFVLDMDAITSHGTPQRMDMETIVRQLQKLHTVANSFFRHPDVFTDHAFKVWKEEV